MIFFGIADAMGCKIIIHADTQLAQNRYLIAYLYLAAIPCKNFFNFFMIHVQPFTRRWTRANGWTWPKVFGVS